MKKRILMLIGLLLLLSLNVSFAGDAPTLNCVGLPGCTDNDISKPSTGDTSNDIGIVYITSIIADIVQFVSVFAVFALIFSGVFYLVSGGEEEKTAKAKKWIIWSLAGVLLSVSAWSIIKILNGLTIG